VTADHYETATDDGTTFLKASSLVPTSDELRREILGDAVPNGKSLEVARQLYEGVDSHMIYDKPTDKPGWGNGDAQWACGNGFGNCTDFHSLFISSARNLKIPARFEIGFSIPTEIGTGEVGGYHCWAKFLSDGKWLPVDISEADKHPEMKDYYFGNLTANRIMFSVGRDLELQPAASSTVNYLVYPHAEVDGKQHKSFRKAFRYKDVKPE
jgi:transglutaminase-like putative cysteine protease